MHDDAHCNKKCTPRGHCCVLELETLLAEVQQARAFRCQVVPRKEGRCSNAITQVSSALACNDSKKTQFLQLLLHVFSFYRVETWILSVQCSLFLLAESDA